jgi:hypothetical protein
MLRRREYPCNLVLGVHLMSVPKVRILGSFEPVDVAPTFLETESKMTAAELAAYIGAAAWPPQIGAWIYRLIVSAKDHDSARQIRGSRFYVLWPHLQRLYGVRF